MLVHPIEILCTPQCAGSRVAGISTASAFDTSHISVTIYKRQTSRFYVNYRLSNKFPLDMQKRVTPGFEPAQFKIVVHIRSSV